MSSLGFRAVLLRERDSEESIARVRGGGTGERSCESVRRGLGPGHSPGVSQVASRIEERRRQDAQLGNELEQLREQVATQS